MTDAFVSKASQDLKTTHRTVQYDTQCIQKAESSVLKAGSCFL